MVEHQSKYHTTTSETEVEFGGDDGENNDMLFSDSCGGDNQQHHSTSSTVNNADIDTNAINDCTYENNIEISKTYPEYEQLMADALAANIDIINKRGTSILSLFQPQDYIHVEDDDIIDNNEDSVEAERNETTANLLSYLEVVEDNGEVELDTSTTTHTTTDNNMMCLQDFNYMIGDDNRLYNMQEHNEGVGKYGGIRSLTQRALSRSKTTRTLSTFKEARLMFGILNCLVNQTAKQQEEFLVHNRNLIDFLLDGKGAPPIEIPCDRKSANDICLQNRHSMFINIPCCNVIDIDGFACIEVDDVLDHMFASGVEFDFPQDNLGNKSSSGFNGTDAVQSLLREQQQAVLDANPEMRYRTCYGHIMSWSDSFLLRFLRQRDNSIWLFVVRICPPPGKSTSKMYMRVLAFGQSKKNKDNVLAHYFKSFQDLMPGKMRYYGHKDVRGMVYTSFGSALHLGDTPDRNATTKSMHLGIYGKRSGWAGKIDLDKLPYCSSCFARACNLALLYEDAIPDESMNFACTRCCGWDYESTGRAIEFDTTEGTAYPTTCSPSNPHPAPKYRTANERYIRPVKQSFEWMIQGVKFAYYEHLHGDWNMTTTRYYLATMAINHEVQEMVIKAVEKAKQHGPAAVTEIDYIPKLWLLDYDFEKFIETIMHLIGHGIVASIMGLMQNILKEHSLGTTFENFCNPYLKDIEACRLQWIRVKTLPKSSWLAEDEFGFARVMLFLYGQFFNKQDLGRVTANSTLLSQTLLQIKQLLNSCVVMISLIMSKENICTNVLDIHIKIFLQCCHRLCRAYYDDSVEEFWFAKSNFISLLNLTKQVKSFGPARYAHEGPFEAIIPQPKGILKHSRKTISSFITKMRLMCKLDFIKNVYRDLHGKPETEERRYHGARIYKSRDEIVQRFNEGKVLSGFQEEGRLDYVFVPYAVGRSTCKVVMLERNVMIGDNGWGMTYVKYSLLPTLSDTYEKSDLDMSTHFCLLLPYEEFSTDEFDTTFFNVSHEWLALRRTSGHIELQRLCKTIFRNSNVTCNI